MRREHYRWTILGITYLVMLSFAVAYHSIPPVLPLIMKELQLSHAQGGFLMSVFALPGIVVALLSGMISDRDGISRVGWISITLMVLGTLISATSRTYVYLLLGRTITGIGGLAISVPLYSLLSQWFMEKELGLAMGILNTSYPLGTFLSFNIFGYLGMTLTWRAPIWVSFGTGVLSLLGFLLFCREPQRHEETSRAPFSFSMILGIGLPIWLLAFSWTSFESVIISFLTFGPDYFLGKGLSLAIASAFPALIMSAHVIFQPFAGWLLDRLGKEEYFIGTGGFFMAILMIVMTGEHESYLILIILLSIFSSIVPTPVFAFVPKLVAPLYLGLAFGIVNSLSNLGRVLMPYFLGAARDYTGDYRVNFIIMSILSLGITINITLVAFRIRKKKY